MDENHVSKDLAGVPLMASVARRIIEELFQRQRQWRRADLATEVERIHLERGGLKGKQDPQRIVKKALSVLEEDAKVYSPAYGQWRWRAPEDQASTSTLEEGVSLESNLTSAGEDPDEEITPEKQIGEGPETVYVYYSPNDRRLADLQGRDTWECKIGRTASADASGRIAGQGAKTALSRFPVVGLVIRTQDSAALERALHASLRIPEKEVEDSPGAEWFMTSPAHVEAWFNSFQEALEQLRGTQIDPG